MNEPSAFGENTGFGETSHTDKSTSALPQQAGLQSPVPQKQNNPSQGGGFDGNSQAELFSPIEPTSLEEAGLTVGEVGALILKYLLESDSASGRQIAGQVKLPFGIIKTVLQTLKSQLMVRYKASAPMSDYEYELDSIGVERARRYAERCTYCGTAPVSLSQYNESVRSQSLRHTHPCFEDFFAAYSDLVVTPTLISQIGQAVYSSRSLLLYGAPGNGKTKIAERLILGIQQPIWIPRTISIAGEIIRLFDPSYHEEDPLETQSNLLVSEEVDQRWVRVKRPTVIVGAELTLQQLGFTTNEATGIIESSLQMKANCGAFVIDDFGRQNVGASELLNRWIVPLEKGHDYLGLPSGRQVQVPFDQLLVFATNLDPKQLLDEALQRRIPYKIELSDPSEDQFREIFQTLASEMGLDHQEETIKELLEKHFTGRGRPLRYCLVGELLSQAKSFCEFHKRPLELTAEVLDVAVNNYFAGL